LKFTYLLTYYSSTDLETEPVTILALEGVESRAPLGKLDFPCVIVGL